MHHRLSLNLKLRHLQAKLRKDPFYRLKSGEEMHLAAQLGWQIDVNQADVDDWLRLPLISIHQARSLAELSRSGVKFYCIEDIAAALSIPISHLTHLQPLLNFSYYDNEFLDHPTYLIDPNTAAVDDLMKIPAINPDLAAAIVQNRLSFGNFRNLVDFQKRLKLSGEAIAQLMYCLRFF